jgi:tRNA threonylcarbamoyladenosine biosynthesis protein TsaB
VSLTLAIETSSIEYGVALFTPDALIAHRTLRRDDPSFRGIGELAAELLTAAGRRIRDVERLAVDLGPGNLSSVRAGVAYVNGLAFSLGIPIFGVSSLDLLAVEASEKADPAEGSGSAVLCLRNAGGGDVYAGRYRGGFRGQPGEVDVQLRRGPLAAVVMAMVGDPDGAGGAGGLSRVLVAGSFRGEVAALLAEVAPGVVVIDTGIEVPPVLALCRLATAADGTPADMVGVASPLTDSSPVFR